MNTLSAFVEHDVDQLAATYRADGFSVGPQVIPGDLIKRASKAMDDIMAGNYDTGVAPIDKWWKPDDDPKTKLRKIDQPHLASHTIRELFSHPAFGEAIAAITGAKWLQAWTTQLLFKPPTPTSTGAVGWHQDYQYWSNLWTPDSELFTVWLAISDVREDCGPVCFIPGSHHWGLLNAGNFFDSNESAQDHIPSGAEWKEVAALLPAGSFSLHDKLTYHGSYANQSGLPRRGFAVHLRTDRSQKNPDWKPESTEQYDYLDHLDDPVACPVLFEA